MSSREILGAPKTELQAQYRAPKTGAPKTES